MSRMTPFSSPLLLGFDSVEKTLERIAKGGDGYPPYNIERIRGQAVHGSRTSKGSCEPGGLQPGGLHCRDGETADLIRITLAVAGFSQDDLEVTSEENQLVVRGRQSDDTEREYLHRGIAARQFQKSFLLADGMRIIGAQLKNGLLLIDLAKPEPERIVKKIAISLAD